MEGMSKEAIWQMVQQLQAGLQAREKQLERQGQQLANMQEVQHHLQVRPHALTYTLVQGRGILEGKGSGQGERSCVRKGLLAKGIIRVRSGLTVICAHEAGGGGGVQGGGFECYTVPAFAVQHQLQGFRVYIDRPEK